jgi:putative transcriptional regulator
MSKKYRSDAMAAIHETMEALHDVGAIDKQTMRRFDDACLTPIRPLKPEEPTALSAGGSAARSGLPGPRSSF